MIRLTLLSLAVSGIALYAIKDWYRGLCGLILLMGVVEHPDMPKSIAGIQGLNPWNLLCLVVLLAWLTQKRREGLRWDMPRSITGMLWLYFVVILIGFVRLMGDRSNLDPSQYTTSKLISEQFINTVKWVIPGLLLFHGCNSRERFRWGLLSLLGIYFLLALQVIRWMPPSAAISGADLSDRSLKVLMNEVGFHRVNLSMMLAGASWACLALRPTIGHRGLTFLAFILIAYAQALTGGRAGYIAWAAVGLTLCMIRWRGSLLVAPVVLMLVIWLVPGAEERMLLGFTPDTKDSGSVEVERFLNENAEFNADGDGKSPDAYTVTAGRNIAWPFVVDKIAEAPVFGWGRLAMERTGLTDYLWTRFQEAFPHPHNAYLEWLLDNGWFGFVLVMPFYLVVALSSFILFRDSRSPLFVTAGGVTLALVTALLFASFGSQTFYPREGAVGMWCAIGLMLRVWVERRRATATAADPSVDGLIWRVAG